MLQWSLICSFNPVTSEASANYINYILCVTFAMDSITIGYNLAISPMKFGDIQLKLIERKKLGWW